ncbi:MAG: hypothetical protein KAR51_04855, partial [Candidatus Aenigmarchaeota archaeon]|nr:hypothetical protein [Candidatus Aenigmarchaeota archaeon]
ADGLRTYRRIMEITEVTKDWDENPQKEKAFQPLMKYDSKTDRLEPTDRFLNGESLILNEIADRVKDWKNNWDSVWENIQLRTKVKEALLNYAKVSKDFGILEAEFTTEANSRFHLISQDVKEQYGALDTDRIFERWDAWTKQKVKDRQRLMKG